MRPLILSYQYSINCGEKQAFPLFDICNIF